MMIESTFEKLLEALVSAGVDFITVGGIAVSLNGFVRLTEDVDILIDNAQDNVARTIAVLSTFGEGYASELCVQDFPREEGAVRVIEESVGLQVDIFVLMRGKDFTDFATNILYFESSNKLKVPYLDSKGLIELKSQSVREKDQIDVSVLSKPSLD